MKKPVYLRCLDVENNHYKYYKMTPLDNNMFRAEWGREGSKAQVKEYPMSKWDSVYRSKTKKGYEDKSEHFVLETVATTQNEYVDIPDKEVAELVAWLLKLSRDTVKANYNISAKNVTQKMIDEAQGYINQLVKLVHNSTYPVKKFNEAYVKLLNTVPRKIAKLDKVLCPWGLPVEDTEKLMKKIIADEEALLDNMRTCVAAEVIEKDETVERSNKTILETMGIELVPCNEKEERQIRATFTADDKKFGLDRKMHKAFAVKNKKTDKAFKKFKKDYKGDYSRFPCKLLWHGSRNENWWSIINNGLKIRPSNAVYTGSMFGDGIYFANKAKKSYGYTSSRSAYWTRESSDTAVMALYDVATGKSLDTDNNRGEFSRMNFEKIRDKDCHSVFAHAGAQLMNDEIIIYSAEQVTIKYLVLFKD